MGADRYSAEYLDVRGCAGLEAARHSEHSAAVANNAWLRHIYNDRREYNDPELPQCGELDRTAAGAEWLAIVCRGRRAQYVCGGWLSNDCSVRPDCGGARAARSAARARDQRFDRPDMPHRMF